MNTSYKIQRLESVLNSASEPTPAVFINPTLALKDALQHGNTFQAYIKDSDTLYDMRPMLATVYTSALRGPNFQCQYPLYTVVLNTPWLGYIQTPTPGSLVIQDRVWL